LAASSDLRRFVSSSLVLLVDQWQRRVGVITRESARLKQPLVMELNRTTDKIASLRDDVKNGFFQLKQEIHDVESELYLGVLKGFHLNRLLIDAKRQFSRTSS
jgi:hypothetical protein